MSIFYKRFCSIIALLTLFLIANLQAQEAGRVRLSLAPERIQYLDRIVQSYGLDLEVYLSDYVSMSYRFAVGGNETNGLYAHIPMGTWFAAYPFTIYVNTDDEFYFYATLLSIALPETFNFHIHLSDNFHLSPYLSPFSMYYEEDGSDLSASFEAGYGVGVRLNVFNREHTLALAPYLGIRSLYQRNSNIGLVAGGTLGFIF